MYGIAELLALAHRTTKEDANSQLYHYRRGVNQRINYGRFRSSNEAQMWRSKRKQICRESRNRPHWKELLQSLVGEETNKTSDTNCNCKVYYFMHQACMRSMGHSGRESMYIRAVHKCNSTDIWDWKTQRSKEETCSEVRTYNTQMMSSAGLLSIKGHESWHLHENVSSQVFGWKGTANKYLWKGK